MVPTEEYGAAPIAELFERAKEEDDAKVLEKGEREFVFPKSLTTLSTRFGNKTRSDSVDYLQRHETEKQLYRVRTSTGESVTVTEDHSVMVKNDRGRLEERTPTELEPGDTIIRITDEAK